MDAQQIGFVRGRHILDNILAYKVGKEFSKIKKFLAFLLKLDFLKAYDRLDHFSYGMFSELWALANSLSRW